MSRQLKLLDSISEDDLWKAIGIYLIGLIRRTSENKVKAHTLAVSKVWMPASYLQINRVSGHIAKELWEKFPDAILICLIASSSSSTHSCQPLSPYCIAPKIIFETLRPEFPSRTSKWWRSQERKSILQSNDSTSSPYGIFFLESIVGLRGWSYRTVIDMITYGFLNIHPGSWIEPDTERANGFEGYLLQNMGTRAPKPCRLVLARNNGGPLGINRSFSCSDLSSLWGKRNHSQHCHIEP